MNWDQEGKHPVWEVKGTEIALYETNSGQLIRTLHWNESRIEPTSDVGGDLDEMAMAFAPDGKSLVTGASGGLVCWSVRDGKRLYQINNDKSSRWKGCNDIRFSPDGLLLAVANRHTHTAVLSPRDGRLLQIFNVMDSPMTLAFSPDGRYLAVGGEGNKAGRVQIWEVGSLK